MSTTKHGLNRVSIAGLIITLGIVYGDIGTSPLYVFKAIGAGLNEITQETVLGALSCVIWTLVLQTTVKYVIITLRANNKGEGGIFALFALLRKQYRWAYLIALIGGSTLLADGIITPSITVTSAIEGLKIINPDIPVIPIVVSILSAIFFIQQFGTRFLGKSFGPVMLVWFSVLAIWGSLQMVQNVSVLKAFNPYYAINLLTQHPGGFLVLGAVFLATTGAEALYSDLGHCGVKNIRISWIFVKTALLLNYFGQAAWIIKNPDYVAQGYNPFYAIMPSWFIVPGIIIATLAAIIASQALISGSFTLISEAISLNLWPKMSIKYPTETKGQMYIPNLNIFLWVACVFVVLLFQNSSAMEAAYGLSISITMLATTLLLMLYLRTRTSIAVVISIVSTFLTIETVFLIANLHKFAAGGWFTLAIGGILAVIMYVWYNGRIIKNNLMEFVPINQLLEILKKVREDVTIPKFATNLAYITKANNRYDLESTIVYSLLHRQPKRAENYWLIHIDISDEPYAFEYEVTEFVKGCIFKIDFYLGFRVEPQINLFFRQVLRDMDLTGEIHIESGYPSLKEFSIPGDCRYVIIDRILSPDHKFNFKERLIMDFSNIVRVLAIPEAKSLHLDASNTYSEPVPLGKPDKLQTKMKRRINKAEFSPLT